jgi:glycosyltransferase involved in cell wall biosynthesis
MAMRDVSMTVPNLHLGETEQARLRALVVDPSNFSPAYDHCLCDALWKQGCDVALVCSEDIYGAAQSVSSFPIRKQFYPKTHAYAKSHARGRVWRMVKAAEHAVCMKRLEQEIARSSPKVVHFQWLPLPVVDGLFLPGFRRKTSLVVTLHNTSIFHDEPAYRLQGLGFRSALNNFDAVIVHTEYSRRKALEQGWIKEDKIHVIPHGALDHYRALNWVPERSAAQDEQVVLFFGSLKQYKGVDVLIRAFAMLPPAVRAGTKLHIAGYPAMDVEPLRELARQSGVSDRIKWDLRFFAEDEIGPLFQGASIVALPYREIDQSGVLLAAIALEKPVVATRIGGIGETITDGVHGLLVHPGDPAPFADAMEKILEDSNRRLGMENAMSMLRREFSWDKIAEKTIQLYSRL